MGKLLFDASTASLPHDADDAAEASWALHKASQCLAHGDLQIALSLLSRAQTLHPSSHGLPELLAVAEVCLAASSVDDACSCGRQQHHPYVSPNWYQILKVDENSDTNTIKKRYRQLALLLHPDKNKHVRAEDAFKLVSEAYAHLNDKNKRAAFDLYLKRKQCKKCSTMTRLQSDIHDMRFYKRSLKGKNHTFHGFHFSSDIHTAEWKLGHEKLRIFRQRAQAKVDTLAQMLKERRSRWNEEMNNIRGRHHRRTVGDTWQYIQEDYEHASSLRSYSKKRNAFKENCSDSILIAEYKKIVCQRAELSLLEELHGRKSIEAQTPEVLRRLDELLVALKEEIGANGSASRRAERAKLRDSKQFVSGKEKMKDGFKRSCFPLKNDCSDSKLEEEELTVIDDFLAGLQCFSEDNLTEAINTDYKSPKTSCSTASSVRTRRNDSRISRTNVFKELPSFASNTTLSDKRRTVKEKADPSVVTQSRWKLPMFDGDMQHYDVGGFNNTNNEEEMVLQGQKKRSEQLMRTLERLREETKSVAATLESLKEHATGDSSNHVNAFGNGGCYIIAM